MNRKGILVTTIASILLTSFITIAQQTKKPTKEEAAKAKAQAKAQELNNQAMKKWLEEDAAYIITDDEKATFKRLKTDEEREQFIEQFWLRRDPTPDTVENEYKEE